MGERVWVDRTDCKPLVDNITTAFATNLTPKNPTLLENISHSLSGGATGTTQWLTSVILSEYQTKDQGVHAFLSVYGLAESILIN